MIGLSAFKKAALKKAAEKTAAVTIVLALILPAFTALFIAAYRYAEERRNDLDFSLAVHGLKNTALASYDRKLYREFGIYGVDLKSVSAEHVYALTSEMNEKPSFQLIADSSAFSPEILQKRIAVHMKIRAPYILAADLLQKNAEAAAKAELDKELIKSIELPAKPLEELEQSIEDYKEIKGKELEDSEAAEKLEADQKMLLVESRLEDLKAGLLPLYTESNIEFSDSDFTSPAKIAELARFSDKINSYVESPLNGLGLREYLLNYFPAAVNIKEGAYLKTPYGENLASFSERKAFAERIITAEADSGKAAKQLQRQIIALRILYNFAEIYNDKAKMAIYQASAFMLAALVSLVSLGNININPQHLLYLMVLSMAVVEANQDFTVLKAGGFNDFSLKKRGQAKIKFYYRDYLRLFAFLKSDAELLENISDLLCEIFERDLSASFYLQADYRQKKIEIKADYFDYEDDSDEASESQVENEKGENNRLEQ